MNKIPVVVIVLGIILTLAGIIVLSNIEEDAVEAIGEGKLYEGADGEMKITGKSNPEERGSGIYVHINGTYEGGGEGGYNENHENWTWNLTEENCNLVKTFTLTHNEKDTQVFIPRCNYIEDDGGTDADDDWIVVGTLCTQQTAGERNFTGDGCPDGTYTWNTGGEVIMVYDLDKLMEGIIGAVIAALGSFGAICCGVLLLLIGIILAFTMADPQDTYMGDNQDSNLFNQAAAETGVKSASGWDDQEDYIRKEKTEEVEKTKEEAPETDQKKGEYNIPPPE